MLKDFFESSSPADYANDVINTKNPNENIEIVAKIKDRIKKKMSEREKKLKCWWDTKDCWRNSWLQ